MSTSEKLVVRLKNYNARRPLRLYRRHYYIRNMFNAAKKEFKNTTYYRYVERLYKINQRRRLYLRRNHSYIKRMYRAFLNAKKAKIQKQQQQQQSSNKKAALLIGINYKGTNSELRGCENDILNTKKVLISRYGYKESEIVMLAESFGEKPTRANILKHMQALVNKSNNGCSSLWFQYAGHGYYTSDYNGDETDKKDECIVTSDMKLITDDEFKQVFTSRINKNAKMFCLMDCCHSGTIMDLKYKYTSETRKWTTENKYNVSANIIALSGCRDDQTSADAWMDSNWCGALTTCFIKALVATNYKPDVFSLLYRTRKLLAINKFTQIPQLTSTRTIQQNEIFSV